MWAGDKPRVSQRSDPKNNFPQWHPFPFYIRHKLVLRSKDRELNLRGLRGGDHGAWGKRKDTRPEASLFADPVPLGHPRNRFAIRLADDRHHLLFRV